MIGKYTIGKTKVYKKIAPLYDAFIINDISFWNTDNKNEACGIIIGDDSKSVIIKCDDEFVKINKEDIFLLDDYKYWVID